MMMMMIMRSVSDSSIPSSSSPSSGGVWVSGSVVKAVVERRVQSGGSASTRAVDDVFCFA